MRFSHAPWKRDEYICDAFCFSNSDFVLDYKIRIAKGCVMSDEPLANHSLARPVFLALGVRFVFGSALGGLVGKMRANDRAGLYKHRSATVLKRTDKIVRIEHSWKFFEFDFRFACLIFSI